MGEKGVKPRWLCRFCTNKAGEPWATSGQQTTCGRCSKDKSRCFKCNKRDLNAAPSNSANKKLQESPKQSKLEKQLLQRIAVLERGREEVASKVVSSVETAPAQDPVAALVALADIRIQIQKLQECHNTMAACSSKDDPCVKAMASRLEELRAQRDAAKPHRRLCCSSPEPNATGKENAREG